MWIITVNHQWRTSPTFHPPYLASAAQVPFEIGAATLDVDVGAEVGAALPADGDGRNGIGAAVSDAWKRSWLIMLKSYNWGFPQMYIPKLLEICY